MIDQLRFELHGSYGCIVAAGIPGERATVARDAAGVRRQFTLAEALEFLDATPRSSGVSWQIVLKPESAREKAL